MKVSLNKLSSDADNEGEQTTKNYNNSNLCSFKAREITTSFYAGEITNSFFTERQLLHSLNGDNYRIFIIKKL